VLGRQDLDCLLLFLDDQSFFTHVNAVDSVWYLGSIAFCRRVMTLHIQRQRSTEGVGDFPRRSRRSGPLLTGTDLFSIVLFYPILSSASDQVSDLSRSITFSMPGSNAMQLLLALVIDEKLTPKAA
jgi:hypothetical protein